jgi:hypothetical protein
MGDQPSVTKAALTGSPPTRSGRRRIVFVAASDINEFKFGALICWQTPWGSWLAPPRANCIELPTIPAPGLSASVSCVLTCTLVRARRVAVSPARQMSKDPWADLRADLRGALLSACNGDADCAELAVSRIAEHVKTDEALIQCAIWPRRSAARSWGAQSKRQFRRRRYLETLIRFSTA